MCGIAGIFSSGNSNNNFKNLNDMVNNLYHRGPDDSGLWRDNGANIFLGHTRLAIQDLTESGSQPIKSFNNRLVMVFNGEIYNHFELRNKLANDGHKIRWNGTSDSETLINIISVYGLEKVLPKLRGMFAFAIWDLLDKKLFLVRDRFGEKPLYWGFSNNSSNCDLIFASEISSFLENKSFKKSLNQKAIDYYKTFGWIPAPLSIYKNVFQLEPGTFLEIESKNNFFCKSNLSHPNKWWSISDTKNQKSSLVVGKKTEDILYQIEDLLKKAIVSQSISDVKLGTFLSGGIDSSLLTAILNSTYRDKISALTVSFSNSSKQEGIFDESMHAEKIANYLSLDHVKIELSQEEAISNIPKLSNIYSEPFADSSQLPSILLCEVAKNYGLSVALSGDGGDELFGGYNRYKYAPNIHKIFSKNPSFLNSIYSKAIKLINPRFIGLNSDPLAKEKIIKLSNAINNSSDPQTLYSSLLSSETNPDFFFEIPQANTLAEELMKADLQTYLPSDILVKIDRASMASSLETRAPFLDYELAEFALQLPLKFKIKKENGTIYTKWCLRKILEKYIPKELFSRPKSGFAIPLGFWLRGPLKDWAEDLLSEDIFKKYEWFDYEKYNRIWRLHRDTDQDYSHIIWKVLMAHSWLIDNKF